jgi:hypothetical protein
LDQGRWVAARRTVQGGERPGDVVDADAERRPLRGLAAAVADHLHVGGQQLPQPDDVAFPEGVEESPGQFLALTSVGFKPGPAASMWRRAQSQSCALRADSSGPSGQTHRPGDRLTP